MIKSAHSILGLTLGFWKRPFSQVQHKWCNTSNEDAIGGSARFLTVILSTKHSWHASALFLPLYQLDRFYHRIHRWASWSILCSEQKAKVRVRGAAEIRSLHCSHIVYSFAHLILISLLCFLLFCSFHLTLNDSNVASASLSVLPMCDLSHLARPLTDNAEL